MQGAGVAVSAIGSYYAAKAQRSVMQMQADAARTNAILGDLTADNVLSVANTNADLAVSLATLNNDITRSVSALNISQVSALNDFNNSLADGNYALTLAKGEFQAVVAEGNAQLAERQAQDTLRSGQQKEQQSRLQYAGLKGHQRASLAANGVVIDEGTSALRVITDTDFLSDVDASIIQNTAVNAALGYRMDAVNQQTAAAFARLNAKSDAMSIKIGAMGANISAMGEISGIQMSASFDILQRDISTKMDNYNRLTAARSDAFNLRIGAGNARSQAISYAGAAAGTSPLGSASTSLLGGAARVAEKWYSYSKAGM